jgi:uncharacterized protein involved in exopolysaccharide biosynthesis
VDDEVKNFADYLAILTRRRTLVLFTFLGILLAGTYVTYSITPIYVSAATFRVQQQSIADYVETSGTGNVDEQIQLVRQRVMSVDELSEVIDKFGLYPETTGGGPANYDAVENLRSAVVLEPEYTEVFNQRTGRTAFIMIAFQMLFEYSDAELTQKVAAEIAGLFLTENQKIRTAQAEDTVEFLARDLREAEEYVNESASKLADFRERHAGNLPDMTDFNLQAMQRTERQIEAIDEDLRAARDRKQLLETELADPNLLATVYDENGDPIVGTAQRLAELQRERLQLLSTYSPEHPDVIKIEKEIDILAKDMSASSANSTDILNQLNFARTDLSLARQRYSEDHPDVRRLVNQVATLERQLEDVQRQPPSSVNLASQDPVVQQLQARIRAQETDIQTFQARRAELVAKLADGERRMLRMPQIEREYAGLTRDYEAAVTRAKEARETLEEAETAGRLEAEGGGARFILTDPPQLPKGPDKPNRLSLLIISGFLAIIIGVTAAIAKDSMDSTVRETRDLIRITDAPPIAVIPYIETAGDRRKRIAGNFLMSGVVCGCIALIVMITQSAV